MHKKLLLFCMIPFLAVGCVAFPEDSGLPMAATIIAMSVMMIVMSANVIVNAGNINNVKNV